MDEQDLDRYRDWEIELLYYKMFPLIMRDFMGKSDCKLVHATGNITAPTTGGPVVHILQGGLDMLASAKKIQYGLLVQEGRMTLSVAEETGIFSGRSRG